MCLALFLNTYGKWTSQGSENQEHNTFSERFMLGISGYFLVRSFVLAFFAFMLLKLQDVEGKIQEHHNDICRCELCCEQAVLNPRTMHEFSYCSSLFERNGTTYMRRENSLEQTIRSNILDPR